MGELGVVAAPLAHAVEPLEDPARHAPCRMRVVVRPRDGGAGGRLQRGEDRVLVLLHRRRIGRAPSERGDSRRHDEWVRRADRGAQVGRVGQQRRGQDERPGP
jgi:hypothetical protein